MAETTRKRWSELKRSELEEIVQLWVRVWPQKDRTVDEMEKNDFPVGSSHQAHLARDSGLLVAVARTFEREIEFVASRERRTVLALAGVCSDPEWRGRGLGATVVKDALSRVDEGEYPLSLYQTGVPEFYEKLGAGIVENRFINSLNETDPEANPWWDDYLMIYPASSAWDDGLVDLLGPGY